MNNRGKVSVFQYEVVEDSITRPANTTAYAAGDAVSEVTTNDYLTFTSIAGSQPADRSGTILSAVCTSSASQTTKPDLELWLFDTAITEVADNSAWSVTDAEILTLVGVIEFPVSQWKSATNNSACIVNNLNLDFVTADGSRNLFGQLVVRNAYTPISSEVFKVRLVVNQA